jgi:putative sigma-54 modulation protein
MRLNIRSKHIEMTMSLREHIARRLGFGLNRFRDGIDRLKVNLTELHGNQNRREYLCVIMADLTHRGMVFGTGLGPIPEAAVHRAMDRVVRRLIVKRKIHLAKRVPVGV